MMLTAYPDPELAARATKEFGVGLFIAKPFDLGYFVQLVSAVLRNPEAAGRPGEPAERVAPQQA